LTIGPTNASAVDSARAFIAIPQFPESESNHPKGGTMKLASDLYAYVWRGNDNNCNTYLFANALSDNRHILVDPGHVRTPFLGEPAIEVLQEGLRADGIDPGAIGLVLLTHCHPDHCESANLFRKESGAQVAIHEVEKEFYEGFGGTVDRVLTEGDLDLGEGSNARLTIYHSPGHSPGHITIYDPARKVLVAGDLIFYRSTGRVDLPGGSMPALKESIERLAKLEIETVLCGHPYGHPGVIEGKDEVRENFEFLSRFILG
jgi:glyoxylase-like metal-dependent hydrolase (beta-lactamase superfamily II)